MDNILICPSSEKEKNLLQDLLHKMKIKFQTISEEVVELSAEEVSEIEKGLEDFKIGDFVSSEEVHKMMKECLK